MLKEKRLEKRRAGEGQQRRRAPQRRGGERKEALKTEDSILEN